MPSYCVSHIADKEWYILMKRFWGSGLSLFRFSFISSNFRNWTLWQLTPSHSIDFYILLRCKYTCLQTLFHCILHNNTICSLALPLSNRSTFLCTCFLYSCLSLPLHLHHLCLLASWHLYLLCLLLSVFAFFVAQTLSPWSTVHLDEIL